MNIYVNGSEFLKHLSYWHHKSNDECIKLVTNNYGVNAEEALMNLLERDLCTSINNGVIKQLIALN